MMNSDIFVPSLERFVVKNDFHKLEYSQHHSLFLAREELIIPQELLAKIDPICDRLPPITNNCRDIARLAQESINGTIIWSSDIPRGNLISGNHYLLMTRIQDLSVALDFTAYENIFGGTGDFRMLGVVSPNDEALFRDVSGLYGGEWEIKKETFVL